MTVVILSACKKTESSAPSANVKADSILPGAGYANDVYYSFANGVVASVSRTNWDLAFSTPVRTASILINDGAGIQLFTWKGGLAADFNNLGRNDSANVTETSSLINNNLDTTWFNSAFEQNMDKNNQFNTGWGTYNINTHNVEGDSCYILRFADGSYKKIVILLHAGTSPYSFVFKIANLEANAPADSITVTATQYATKNFVYYSIANKQVLDREPANTSWDVVFTKYADKAQGGYPVAGFLSNEGVETSMIEGADTTKAYNQVTYSKVIGNIGYDWKTINQDYTGYDIVSGRYYYVKAKDGHYYRLKFDSFSISTRETKFEKKLLK